MASRKRGAPSSRGRSTPRHRVLFQPSGERCARARRPRLRRRATAAAMELHQGLGHHPAQGDPVRTRPRRGGEPRRPLPFPRRLLARCITDDEARRGHVRALLRPPDPTMSTDGALRPFVVAVGPRAAFRRRGVGDRVSSGMRVENGGEGFAHVNRYFRGPVARGSRLDGPGLADLAQARRTPRSGREAFSHRGVGFGDLATRDLAATLLLQLPWAVRSYEEMAACSRRCGRTRGVPVRGVERLGPRRARRQPGRRRARGGRAARDRLSELLLLPPRARRGRLPPARPHRRVRRGHAPAPRGARPLSGARAGGDRAARGSTTAGVARAQDREATRPGWGSPPPSVCSRGRGQPLPAHPRHPRGHRPEFPALLAAVEGRSAWVPWSSPTRGGGAAPYAAALKQAGSTRTRLLPAGEDLASVLPAADALVTVESLSAVEALVLGLPLVILSMPTNLRALVDQGVALAALPAGPIRRRPCGAPCSTRTRGRRCGRRAPVTCRTSRTGSTARPPRGSWRCSALPRRSPRRPRQAW